MDGKHRKVVENITEYLDNKKYRYEVIESEPSNDVHAVFVQILVDAIFKPDEIIHITSIENDTFEININNMPVDRSATIIISKIE